MFLLWALWAFIDDGTLFVALLGAGLAKGAVVALAAIGFIMIMKATGIANFAQGDLITIGGYLALWATSKTLPAHDGLGLSLGLGFLLVLVIMFVLGVIVERVAYAPLSKRAHDVHVVVIATLGVAIILRTVMALWQGNDPRFVRSWFNLGGSLDGFLFFNDGTLTINVGFLGIDDAVISAQRVVIMVVTGVVVLGIMMLFSRTSFGRQVRAIAADRETARLYGVKASRLSMLSFGISAALAGLAGILIGPLGSFDLSLGFSYMLLGFAAAVLGGFGSRNSAVATDMTQQVLAIKDSGANVVMSANFPNPSGVFVNQLRQNGVTIPFVGGASLNLAVDAGSIQNVDNLWASDDCVPELEKDKKAKKFVKEYTAEYGYKPNYASAQLHDIMMFGSDVITKAGNDRAAIIKGLSNVSYDGVCDFQTDNNNLLGTSVTIYKYKGGTDKTKLLEKKVELQKLREEDIVIITTAPPTTAAPAG